MKKIISLTKVFSKEFYENINFLDKQNKKLNKKSIFFWLISIILIGTAFVSYQIITFLVRIGNPEIFLNLFFWVLGFLLLFQIILTSVNLFFFSKDMEKILPLPIKPVELLMAKFSTLLMIMYMIEAIFAVIPLGLYGIFTHANLSFYIGELLVLAIFPILLEVFIIVIELIIMHFGKLFKNKDIFQIVITIVFIIALCFLESQMMRAIFRMKNEEVAKEQFISLNEKVQKVNQYFFVVNPSITILENPFSKEAILEFLKLLGYSTLGGVIFLIIGKYTYFKIIMANSTNYESKRKKRINIENNSKCRHKSTSYIKKEIKMLVREPIFLIQYILPVVIILVTIILLGVILLPMVKQAIGEEMIPLNMEIACDILIVLQILFSFSNISLTAISREGKNANFIKYIPISFYQQFIYKNMPQILFNGIISMVVLGGIWYLIPTMNIAYFCMLFVISFFINLIGSYTMFVVDLRRPSLDWDNQDSVGKITDNKVFSYVFLIGMVLILLYIARIFKEMNLTLALFLEIMIFAIVFFLFDRFVKKKQDKLFDKIN